MHCEAPVRGQSVSAGPALAELDRSSARCSGLPSQLSAVDANQFEDSTDVICPKSAVGSQLGIRGKERLASFQVFELGDVSEVKETCNLASLSHIP